MIRVPRHARKQILKRGIRGEDVQESIKHVEVIIEEVNGRVGLKKYSKLRGLFSDLIVIWYYDKKGDEIAVTAYWRRRCR